MEKQQTFNSQNKYETTFIIQHMEPYLFQWCLSEYKQMKDYLQNYNVRLWITNSKAFLNYQGDNADQNAKFVQALKQYFNQGEKGKYQLIQKSVIQLKNQLDLPLCMLDMRAQKQLAPNQKWSTLIFGGILGDHPPRDRPQPVRKHFQNIRHLGDLQLATDTAVLVCRLILQNKLNLKQIPMIKQPTIKGKNKQGQNTAVQMEGFSYISKQLDINSGKLRQNLTKKQKKQIYMSEGVKQLLIRQDLDQNSIM